MKHVPFCPKHLLLRMQLRSYSFVLQSSGIGICGECSNCGGMCFVPLGLFLSQPTDATLIRLRNISMLSIIVALVVVCHACDRQNLSSRL
jgi:hypothetical protein